MKRAVVLILILSASAFAGSARLYNLATGDVSTMKYHGHGHGSLELTIKDEAFKGEYSTVANGAIAWGNVFSGGTSATSTSAAIPTSGRGSAILSGNKGTVINCEYIASNHGHGACEDNHGTKYKLMF